jgi:hypothetical protein
VHEAIKVDSLPFKDLFEKTEKTIKNAVVL